MKVSDAFAFALDVKQASVNDTTIKGYRIRAKNFLDYLGDDVLKK